MVCFLPANKRHKVETSIFSRQNFLPFQQCLEGICSSSSPLLSHPFLNFFFFFYRCWIHSYRPQNFFVNFSEGAVNLKWRHPYQIFRAWFKTWCVQGHSRSLFISKKHLGFECGCSTMKPPNLINSMCVCVCLFCSVRRAPGWMCHPYAGLSVDLGQSWERERETLKHTEWIELTSPVFNPGNN